MNLLLGNRQVNRLGLGAMRLALGGSVRDPETAVAVLRRAAELGVNHIDTAGTYGFGDLYNQPNGTGRSRSATRTNRTSPTARPSPATNRSL